MGVRLDDFAGLGNEQLAVVVQKTIQRFQHIRRRQIQLVQHEPVATAQGGDEQALGEDKLALGIGSVRAQVFLDVGVLVVVDAHEPMPRAAGEVFHGAGLACTGRALNEHGTLPRDQSAGQCADFGLDAGCQDVIRRVIGRHRSGLEPKSTDLNGMGMRRRRHERRVDAPVLGMREQMALHKIREGKCTGRVQQHTERHLHALGQGTA